MARKKARKKQHGLVDDSYSYVKKKEDTKEEKKKKDCK
jgi:hypothetical protein